MDRKHAPLLDHQIGPHAKHLGRNAETSAAIAHCLVSPPMIVSMTVSFFGGLQGDCHCLVWDIDNTDKADQRWSFLYQTWHNSHPLLWYLPSQMVQTRQTQHSFTPFLCMPSPRSNSAPVLPDNLPKWFESSYGTRAS